MGKKTIKRLKKRLVAAESAVIDLTDRVNSIEVVLTTAPEFLIMSDPDPRAN